MQGKSPVTLLEVAAQAGVSKITASMILNGSRSNTRVSPSTRERVLAAAREMGYRPNLIAQALATGHSRTVTLWTPTDFVPYLALIAHHVREEMRRDGYTLTIWDMPPFGSGENLPPGAFPEWTVSGILVPGGKEWVDAYMERTPSPLPLLSLGAYCSDQADYVSADLKGGSTAALLHLQSMGCQRIDYLVPMRGTQPGDPRYDAYREFIQNTGIPGETIIAPNSARASAHAEIEAHMKRHGPPEGLYCFNDEMAIGANRALREANLRVPEDVALVGCDGIEEMEYHEPPLSTVSVPLRQMCALGWRQLLRRIKDPKTPALQVELPTELIVRRSSRR